MRARELRSFLVFAAVVVCPLRSPRADVPPSEEARRKAIAVHVGTTAVSVGEIEDRLSAVPRFQLRAFGDSPDVIRRRFFDQILLPEMLYAQVAQKSHVGDTLPTSSKIMRAEANAATKALRKSMRPVQSIPMDEVRKHYDENKSKYDSPERLYLFRILCAKQEEALQVLAEAKSQPSLDTFTRLARDHSIDKATSLRAGNLGYLTPDGNSTEAGLSVDPSIVKAASRVRDGEIVPAPVPEAQGFAVIWRRGTLPASHRTVEQAAGEIRDVIWKKDFDEATKKHIAELRAARVTELNEGLLNGIDISPSEGDVITRRRPGEVPPLSQGGRSVPRPTN
jgi:peptidyl-prolyl cis-trans isomerase C